LLIVNTFTTFGLPYVTTRARQEDDPKAGMSLGVRKATKRQPRDAPTGRETLQRGKVHHERIGGGTNALQPGLQIYRDISE
jgi:hypothetical protein